MAPYVLGYAPVAPGRESIMTDSTASTMPPRGVAYLLATGLAGVLMAGFYFVEAFAEISAGRWVRAFAWVVFGVFIGAAAVHLLKLWRGRRSAWRLGGPP
jgi:hypothetical protein